MKRAFVNVNFNDNIPLYKIGDLSIVEKTIKMLANRVDKIYILVSEKGYVCYKEAIRYNCEYIVCDNKISNLENIKGYYDDEDFLLFINGNLIIENINELVELYKANSSLKYVFDEENVIWMSKGNKLKEINLFYIINHELKSKVYVVNKKNYSLFRKIFNQNICNKHLLNGVNIIDVDTTFIGEDVIIGKGTIIYPGNYISGETVIGEGVIVYSNNFIVDSSIGNYCKVGPFSHLKKFSVLEENVEVGAFVEVKNSCLKRYTKAKHHAYIGDAYIGERVNIGAGVIFANYDGQQKHKSFVGKGSFIGSNSVIVSPIKIGHKSFIAAGSTIVEDVGNNSLSIARSRQINKINYFKS